MASRQNATEQDFNDYPTPGDWIDCWNGCDEGFVEGDDPFWDLGELRRCNVCEGKGGWVCEAVKTSDA